MKVLFVIPEYPPDFGGGIGTFYGELLPAMQRQGCEVQVLKGSAFVHGAEPYEFEGVPVSTLQSARCQRWVKRLAHFAVFPELRCHLGAAFALHEQAAEGEGFD